jgi:hypothetical protein
MTNPLLLAFEFVFGCWHRNLSRPFTLSGWTYEVCLNCGKKLAYDRAEIGCDIVQRQNSGQRREVLQEGYASTLFAAPPQPERMKAA